VDLVGQTGAALNRIVEQVAAIDTLVTEISASASEQSTGLNEVNTAVNQMDQVVQQNAAMVEEAAASHSLKNEAKALAEMVSRFRTARSAVQSAPAPTSRASGLPAGFAPSGHRPPIARRPPWPSRKIAGKSSRA
jgi:methyl-accepting chemotaxis protein